MKTNEKQILTLSKRDIMALCIKELERLQDLPKTKSNRGQRDKMYIIFGMVKNASNDLKLTCEGVRGNHKIRDFELFNAGSLIENLVKHYRTGNSEVVKEWNENQADTSQGFWNIEIKASMPNARNTLDTNTNSTILINTKGAYLITKEQYPNVAKDSKGKLYENVDYSEFGCHRYQRLSTALGL